MRSRAPKTPLGGTEGSARHPPLSGSTGSDGGRCAGSRSGRWEAGRRAPPRPRTFRGFLAAARGSPPLPARARPAGHAAHEQNAPRGPRRTEAPFHGVSPLPFAVGILSLSFPSPPSPVVFRGWWRALSREETIWVLKGCVSLFPLTSCFSGCCGHVVRLKGEWRREWLRGGESGEGKRERVTGTAKG